MTKDIENANNWNGIRKLNRHEWKIYTGEYKQRPVIRKFSALLPEVRGMLKSSVENEDVEHIKIKGWKFEKFGIVPLS